MNDNLTPKQERFVQNIVSGMSQRQAYKDAYDAENMKDETIDSEASILFNDQKVSKRYKEIMDKLEDKAIMSARERMIWLSGVVCDVVKEQGIKEADINTKIKAVDILNKMSGEYITKVEADVGIKRLEDLL